MSWRRSPKQLELEIESKLHGERPLIVIEMDRESGRRHDKWCKAMYAVFVDHRERVFLEKAQRSKFIDKVIDGGFHCEYADRLRITWSSPDILKLKSLEIVDAVFAFFCDFNQSLVSISFSLQI